MNTVGRCDECGREMEKAHRVEKGHRYCGTCYARVFKRRMCPKCGNFARLPKNNPDAICRKCKTDKPCARCGKTGYDVGKITPYGPVCNACAPYFRKPEPCGLCGKPSSRLSRDRRLGHDLRVCQRCARSDHGTCAACRRYRVLREAPDGRLLCKACLHLGERDCPSCGQLMPAGKGKLCESCYWTKTCRKRAQMDMAAFSDQGMATAFMEYSEWLMEVVGPHKAALTIHRYLPFFMEIASEWADIPPYTELLRHFGAEGLRRARLPMRWLGAARGIRAEHVLREEDSERRRIEAILEQFPEKTIHGKVLREYYRILARKIETGKLKLRSARLALSPAAALLGLAEEGGSVVTQRILERYLLDSPGQKAALTGFVNFLNHRDGLSLELRANDDKVRRKRRRVVEKRLMDMVGSGPGDGDHLKRWIVAGLDYFHGVRVSGKAVDRAVIDEDVEGGMVVHLRDEAYWLPGCGRQV